jgi:hypothetical protein
MPARTLEVLVLDPQGNVYEQGRIQVLDSTGQVHWLEGVGVDSTINSVGISEGKATLRGLPAELVSLKVKVASQDEHPMREVAIDLTSPLEEPYQVIIP